MTYPTGSLAVVADLMERAHNSERLAESMIENNCWNTAMTSKCEVEFHKQLAGIEFLLWVLAVLQLPPEPTAREIEAAYEARKVEQ